MAEMSRCAPDSRLPASCGLGGERRAEQAGSHLLAALNEAQRQAVEATEGPVLVLAGAGTGKTRVLTSRLAYLLATGRAGPGQVLAVTFTNKAAREMSGRVAALIGHAVDGMWLGTFHAIGARILRRHAELAGLRPNFAIIDSDDQKRLAKAVIEAAGIDEKRWPGRVLAAILARWKDRGWTPDKVPASEAGDFAHGRALDLYRAYQARLAEIGAADFGDLLLLCLNLFSGHDDVLAGYRRRFRYLLVDEYQDANVAQYLWLRLLAQGRHNICCVGDDDQSIYGWRGAEVGNILRFEQDFPGARIVRLEHNYRSTAHILGAASGLIAHNRSRLGKTLRAAGGEAGEKVRVQGVWDEAEEARVVGESIEALQRDGHRLDRMAILVRAGYQTRAFEERLLAIGVPYRVVGGLRFYERLEIRDAVAYFRLLQRDSDDLAFQRIVNTPRRGLGERALHDLHRAARPAGRSLMGAARALAESDDLPARRRRPLKAFVAAIDRWRGQAAQLPPPELARMVLDESGLIAMWTNDTSAQAQGRLENLKELVSAMEEFESLAGFLDHVGLVMDTEDGGQDDMVNIMTLHGAKGLEFDSVFLPGWEEGVLPNQMTLNENGQRGLEEERRLAHVGLTRARHRAFVLHAGHRMVHGQWQTNIPSRFLDELPGEHIERQQAGPAGGGPWQAAIERLSRDGQASRWRRVIEARRQSFGDDDAAAVPVAGGAVPAAGSRIFHQKFGYGRVMGSDGDKLDIAFDKAGRKKVMAAFVTPA